MRLTFRHTNADTVVLPEGQEVLPEGQEVLPEGQEVLPEGQEVLPEGQEVQKKLKKGTDHANVKATATNRR